MMDFDFTQGIEFGRALERLKHHEDRLDHIEASVGDIRKIIEKARNHFQRGCLVASLFAGGALPLNLATDSVGAALRKLVRALLPIA